MTPYRLTHPCLLAAFVLAAAACAAPTPAGSGDPVVYTVRIPSPDAQIAEIDASFPTDGRDTIEIMMPVWSPGYYRVEDYAGNVLGLSARLPDGRATGVEQVRPNRWKIDTGGQPEVLVSYRLLCTRRFVTGNWVSADLGVMTGPSTFVTPTHTMSGPYEMYFELPPAWPRLATGLTPVAESDAHHYRADDYDAFVDAPIVAGDLEVHTFLVDGVPHHLVDAGDRPGWRSASVAGDLARIVEQTLPLWGGLPYEQYLFLNVFRPGGGGLEHANSTLLTTNADRVSTERGYRSWLSFAAHEYFHAFNVKRLRPVELGPFDYEEPPRTASLWFSEGVTSYYGDLFLVRAGLTSPQDFLASVSSAIRQLQEAPGRLLQTLEQSSLEVWSNSNSGVAPAASTVSYYVKGKVVGFLLDAEIRRATDGGRSLDDAMRFAYNRWGGSQGFTPTELRDGVDSLAGGQLGPWLHLALATTEELDYAGALDWYGLEFAEDGSWRLSVRPDASEAQGARLGALVRGAPVDG